MTPSGGGKRKAPRSETSRPALPAARLLGFAALIVLALVAWGYLVYLAIDFGASARGGENIAWVYLGLAALGAVACLFIALIVAARTLRVLGITSPGETETSHHRAENE